MKWIQYENMIQQKNLNSGVTRALIVGNIWYYVRNRGLVVVGPISINK